MIFSSLNLNPLSTELTKWPNTLKQFVGNLPTNCLSVFGHFMGLVLKGLIHQVWASTTTVLGNKRTNPSDKNQVLTEPKTIL